MRYGWFCGVLGTCVLNIAMAATGEGGLQTHRLDATAAVGKRDVGAAKFELSCAGGKGGSIALTVILMHPDPIKSFPLNDFEGPDGIGGSKDLAQWAVDTRGPSTTLKTGIGGWYGVDGDGFVLSTSGTNAPLLAFVRQLVDGKAQRLRLTLSAPHGGEALQASVSLDGARAELARTAAACLGAK